MALPPVVALEIGTSKTIALVGDMLEVSEADYQTAELVRVD